MDVISTLITLYGTKGVAQYGREAVSQIEHALQCALLAEAEEADAPLIAASLLHDVGHLLAKQGDRDVNDLHEQIGWGFLKSNFGPAVAEPVRLHVEAKRYLCAVDSDYFGILSPASVRSLELQGGRHSPAQALVFERTEYHEDAVNLRRWDDRAKTRGAGTKTFADYADMLRGLCR
ncbi:MAG: phosphonate degradation operons associated domain protein [Rhodospirillales bacterium]|jgi:phosphonate degradation associated HDIG domain protein|nr:phosphonate degradation operons associated domain protein [Rhodospirillales bacterium]